MLVYIRKPAVHAVSFLRFREGESLAIKLINTNSNLK